VGQRTVIIRESVATSIAEIAWFIESKGMLKAAENFTDAVYDFFESMADDKRSFALCREPKRRALGLKCVTFKKKYTVVFIESEAEIIISEFLASKRLTW